MTIDSKKTVLIIEPDSDVRKKLINLVADKGCYIQAIDDHVLALRMIGQQPVDVVILDGDHPDADIFGVHTRLQQHNPLSRLFVHATDPWKLKVPDGVELFEKAHQHRIALAIGKC